MGGAAPSANQMAEIKQIPIVGQATRQNNGLQHTSLLQHRHVTRVRQLFVYPLLPTQSGTRTKFKENGHGKRCPLAYIKIKNGGSQKGQRHLHIMAVNGEPHTVRRWRQIIIGHHRKVNVGIVPQIDEGKALVVWVANPFLLLETIRFGEGNLLPIVLAGGSSAATSFPLQQEEPSSFACDMTGI